MKTYENYMDGILSKKEYLTYKAEYEKEERDVREKILLAERRINSLEKEAEVFEQWIERFAGGASPPEITRGILTELIDTITVNGNKSIDLAFRYRFPGE